jgi:hypothetical protein
MKTEFESLELISFKPNAIVLNLHQSEGVNMSTLIFWA